MGEREQELAFRITVRDDGSVKLSGFDQKFRDTAGRAKKSGTVMTRAFQRVGRSIKNVGRSVFSLKGLIVGLATGAVLRGFFGLLKAAGAQEDAVNKLNSALRTAGSFTEEFSRQQQRLASALQAQTRFGDEAILAAQALLITYSGTTDRLEEATKATLDFASATGRSLEGAVLSIAKAMGGYTGELGRLNIRIAKNIPQTEIAAAVLAAFNEKFGGRAQADVNTFSGRMQQLSNLFGDFREQLGFSVINSVRFRRALKGLSAGMVVLNKETGTFLGTELGDAIADLIPTTKALVATFFKLARTIQGFVVLGKGFTAFSSSAALGIAQLRLEFALFSDFVSRNFNQAFVIISQTIAFFVADTLKLLRDTLFTVGDALRSTEKIGVAKLGRGILKLGSNISKAVPTITDFGDNIEKAGRSNQKTAKDVAVATRAVSLARRESKEAARQLDLAQRAFERLGTSAEDAARKIDKAKTAQRQQREEQQQAIKPITTEELAELFATEEILTLTSQLSEARFQQLREEVDFTKISTAEGLKIVKKALTDEMAFRRAARNAAIQETAGLVGSVANLLEASGAASFKTLKKFRIVEAIINGIAAVQQALASLPFPANVIAAASVAVLTAANVAAIRSAQPGGGAGGVGAVSGGVAGGGGGPGAPGEIEPVAVEQPRTQPTNITVNVSGMIGDQSELAARIADLLRGFEEDGGRTVQVN